MALAMAVAVEVVAQQLVVQHFGVAVAVELMGAILCLEARAEECSAELPQECPYTEAMVELRQAPHRAVVVVLVLLLQVGVVKYASGCLGS